MCSSFTHVSSFCIFVLSCICSSHPVNSFPYVLFFCESVSSHCCLPLCYLCHVPMSGSSRCLVSMVVWVTSCFTWLGPCTFSFTSPVSLVVFSTFCLFLCHLVCVYELHKLKLFHNNNFCNFITQPYDCFFFTRAEWSRTLTNRMMSVLIC